MGIATYNQHCRSIVTRYSKEWEVTIKRLGRWIDFENDYKTMVEGASRFSFLLCRMYVSDFIFSLVRVRNPKKNGFCRNEICARIVRRSLDTIVLEASRQTRAELLEFKNVC